MLHTKFQGHRSIGSGEEDFLRFLPYMGMAAMFTVYQRTPDIAISEVKECLQ